MEKNILLSSLSFVAMFIYVTIGIYAYQQGKKSKISRVFLVLCISYAIWSFAYGFVYITKDLYILDFWNKLAAIGWCSVSSIALYIVLMLIESKFINKPFNRFILFLPASVLFVMAITMFRQYAATPKLIQEIFYTLESLYNFSYLLIGMAVIYLWGSKANSKRVKIQAKIIILSSMIPFIAFFAMRKLLIIFLNIDVPNISQLYSVFMVAGIYVAISRYKLLQLPEKFILDQITDEMMDMIVLLNEKGQIIKLSKQTVKMMLYEEKELINSDFSILLNINDNEKITLENLIEDNNKYKDVSLLKKNGEKIPVNISSKRIIDDKLQDLIGIVLIIQDISMFYEIERKNEELQASIGQLLATEEELRYQYDLNLENEQLIRNSEEKFRTIFEEAPLGITLCDSITGQFFETNTKYTEIIGRTAEEIIDSDWMSITHPEDIKPNMDQEEKLTGKMINNYNMNKRYVKPDGSVVWANMTVAKISLEGISNPCEVCMVEDITEKKMNEETLKASEYTFRKLFEESSDSILLMDGGQIIDCNPATMEILGFDVKFDIAGNCISKISPECQPDGVPSIDKFEEILSRIDESGKLKFEWWHIKRNGEEFPVEIMLTSILLNGKKIFHALCRDISERKQMEQRLEYLNYHDQLTGLYNRRFFEEELLRLDVVRNYPLSIVMADVNGLKLINDSMGHAIGDELLKKVSTSIKNGCRSDDIVARLGGDEFVVLLPNTDAFETEQIIKRIKEIALKEQVESIAISISFGYDIKNSVDEKSQDVLKKAEDSMYKNKLFEGPSMRGKTIKTIISTLHEKNKREEQHSHRVSALCKNVAKALHLNEDKIDELITVGLLHDIGKIAIDENILNKPGKLSPIEWEEIKRHPEIGYRILSTVNDMSEMAEYVLAHHERWDGTGYPKGLKGLEIPLQSRIISIIDAYDAMTSERSYRIPLGEEVAISELKKNAGTQFDPEIVEVFIEKVLENEQGELLSLCETK